eukprot:226014_1
MLRTNYSWINGTEMDKLENMKKKTETWLNTKIEEQDEISLLQQPAFFSYEVYYKMEPIVEFAKKLLSRKKPYNWGKKKKKNDTNDTTSASSNDTTNNTEATEDDANTVEIDVEAEDSDGDGDDDSV